MKSKPLYTFLSVFVLSLSITLLLGVQQLKTSFKNQIQDNLGNIDLVVGAKGSPLQLVLASVLHIDNPTGNILYSEAKKIGNNPMVKSAIPISYGDNYKGFRIVGTTPEFLKLYKANLIQGKNVHKSLEVVVGATVAQQLNIKIGDKILSSHGLINNNIDVHADKLTVVGVLEGTEKVIDRLILTNLESVWDVHHHDHDEHGKHHHDEHDEHEEEKEITSLLVTFKNPRALLTYPRRINKNTNLQAALPKYELEKLYEYTSVGFKTIDAIAYLILMISGITIFMSIYKMVKERAFDLAILRTYGASNLQLIAMVVYEGLMIAFSAFLLGFMFVKVGVKTVFCIMESGYPQNIIKELSLQDVWQTIILVFLMVVLSVLLAIYPIVKMNISTILSNEK